MSMIVAFNAFDRPSSFRSPVPPPRPSTSGCADYGSCSTATSRSGHARRSRCRDSLAMLRLGRHSAANPGRYSAAQVGHLLLRRRHRRRHRRRDRPFRFAPGRAPLIGGIPRMQTRAGSQPISRAGTPGHRSPSWRRHWARTAGPSTSTSLEPCTYRSAARRNRGGAYLWGMEIADASTRLEAGLPRAGGGGAQCRAARTISVATIVAWHWRYVVSPRVPSSRRLRRRRRRAITQRADERRPNRNDSRRHGSGARSLETPARRSDHRPPGT